MKRLAIYLFLFGVLTTVVVFMGCGKVSGEPSEANCRTVIENRISKGNLAEEVEIASFKKVDSYMRELMGTKVYVVKFDLEVRYLNNVEREVSLLGISSMVVSNYLTVPSGKKGDAQKISGSMEFLKADKGWQGQDGNFY